MPKESDGPCSCSGVSITLSRSIIGDHSGDFQNPSPFLDFLNQDGFVDIVLAKCGLAAGSEDFDRLVSWHLRASIRDLVRVDITIA
jgi:hypothetical protein